MVLAALAPSGASADCELKPIAPAQPYNINALAEAQLSVRSGDHAKARGLYAWVLDNEPGNRDVRFALAQLDSWRGCYENAEQRYTQLLEEQPEDAEARSGLIDLLIWSDRFDEARSQIGQGLALAPESSLLWRRRAMLYWKTGERGSALRAAEHAEELDPKDADIRALRDRLYVNQLRASARVDLFPGGYPDLSSWTLQALRHMSKLELGVEAQLRGRFGGKDNESIVDGLYSASAQYHAENGMTAGLGLGFGAPSRAVPQLTARLWFMARIGADWSPYLSYSFWQYENDKVAHIFAPALGYAVNDEIGLEARWWTSYIVLPAPSGGNASSWVHAAGLRATWRVLSALTVGAGYTYGPQLDRTPADATFLRLTSHIICVFGDWLVHRDFGLQPLLGLERRRVDSNGAVALIYTAELAAYLRF